MRLLAAIAIFATAAIAYNAHPGPFACVEKPKQIQVPVVLPDSTVGTITILACSAQQAVVFDTIASPRDSTKKK